MNSRIKMTANEIALRFKAIHSSIDDSMSSKKEKAIEREIVSRLSREFADYLHSNHPMDFNFCQFLNQSGHSALLPQHECS